MAGLEWAAAALEELLVLGAWIRMLRARHARGGLNTRALEKLVEVPHEYIKRLEEA